MGLQVINVKVEEGGTQTLSQRATLSKATVHQERLCSTLRGAFHYALVVGIQAFE